MESGFYIFTLQSIQKRANAKLKYNTNKRKKEMHIQAKWNLGSTWAGSWMDVRRPGISWTMAKYELELNFGEIEDHDNWSLITELYYSAYIFSVITLLHLLIEIYWTAKKLFWKKEPSLTDLLEGLSLTSPVFNSE